jgi:putative transposase
MPRIARIVVPDCPYHVTHRGNHKEAIFFGSGTQQLYLARLRAYAARYGMEVWAYCLMPNHVHLIVVGRHNDSLARAIGNTHREYSRRVNQERGWTGHLWANRFHSTALDESHLWNAVRYVESNPTRAGLVASSVDYRWSSARAHAGLRSDPLLAAGRPFPGSIAGWPDWLDAGADCREYDALRKNTTTGRPTGSREFVDRLARELARSIPLPGQGIKKRPP